MNNNAAWDPLHESIDNLKFSSQQAAFAKKIQRFEKRPHLFSIIFALSIIIPIIIVIFIVFMDKEALSEVNILLDFVGLIVVPPLLLYQYIKHIQDEAIISLICKKNNWVYDPSHDEIRLNELVSKYPDIFNYGHSRRLEDQIWGNFSQNLVFWKCFFSYTIGYGRGSSHYVRSIVFIKLNSELSVDFILAHTGLFPNLTEKMKTESEDFNKRFKIVCGGEDSAKYAHILGILSPSVILRMINFYDKFDIESINFQGDVMGIVFKSEIWKSRYTNFIKKAVIDERDEKVFYTYLQEMAELTEEIVKFI